MLNNVVNVMFVYVTLRISCSIKHRNNFYSHKLKRCEKIKFVHLYNMFLQRAKYKSIVKSDYYYVINLLSKNIELQILVVSSLNLFWKTIYSFDKSLKRI